MAVEWTAGTVDPASRGPPDPDEWTGVEVPGRPERFAGAEAVAYRTSFPDPRSTPDQRAILELYGTYAHAEIWLNGERLGSHDPYFVPARFEFDPESENDLRVVCRAPTDRFGGVHGTDRVPERMTVPGIWWDVGIKIRPPTYVADLSLTPRRTDLGAEIDVALTVDSADGVDDRATLSLRPEGFRGGGAMERLSVQAEPGERVTARRTLEVRDPRNWWPWSLGEQYRYTVRAKLDGHETTATTGFCDVDRDGGRLQVNGEPVSLRGFTVLPTDDPIADVEAAREANANVLRAYGHVPRRAFHEACDEAGLLVWQDLPLVGPGGFDVDRGRTLATALVETYGQHPSVATYGVHADPFDPFPEPLGAGRMARLRVRWRVWRAAADREPAERVAEAFPENALALPVSGKPGTSPDAASLYPGWDFGTPGDVEWLLDRYPSLGGLVGGFGAAALTGAVDERSETFDWARHDARVGNDDPGASQAYQARLLETVATALRRRGTSLQVADCLRDTHQAGGMGVLTVDGDRKPGFETLANAFEPVQAILDAPLGEADGVVVRNDSRTPVEGTLQWSTTPCDETPDETTGAGAPEDGSAGVTVPAGGRTRVDAVELPDDGTIELELRTDAGRVHNEYHF